MHQEITGRLNALPSPLWPNRLLTGLYPSKPAAETLHMILVDSGSHKGAINIVPSPQQSISNISPSTSFSTVQRQIEDFLDKLRPRIKTFLEAPNLPSWAPPTTVNGEVHEFYQELKVPAVNGKPRLLLHNLGSNNETADTIFGMSKVVLCNTSGSGKTRALLDGLSTRWGFYLTADPGVDDIGSKDLMEIITGMPNKLEWVNDVFNGASDPKDIQARSRTNERLAMLEISRLLVARWSIFKAFLEVAEQDDGSLPPDIKKSWLLFQITPSTQNVFRDFIQKCLAGVDTLDQASAFPPTIWPLLGYEPDAPFYYVLDEVQIVEKAHMGCFSDSKGREPRPFLRPLIQQLTKGNDHNVIVSGTGFRLEHIQTVLTSSVAKDPTWPAHYWIDDFSNPERQKAYIRRYLPEKILSSNAGRELLQRVWESCRGRSVVDMHPLRACADVV